MNTQNQTLNVKLVVIEIPYFDFDLKIQSGQLEIDATLAEEAREIFLELYDVQFPIGQCLPFHHFDNDDNRSMKENNCYCYGHREAVNKPGVLSWHSYGRAIDINPLLNPYVKGSMVLPEEAKQYSNRSTRTPGVIQPWDPCVAAFESRGWTWGGRWTDRTDYHHFEKPLPVL